jgi:neutral ceramidase
MRPLHLAVLTVLSVAVSFSAWAQAPAAPQVVAPAPAPAAAPANAFRVGAAKIDITPANPGARGGGMPGGRGAGTRGPAASMPAGGPAMAGPPASMPAGGAGMPAGGGMMARGGRGGGASGGFPGADGILDHIYVRAIVIDNGTTSAALVSVDSGMVGEQVWSTVSQRIEKELGIPASHLIMNPIHTHSASGGSADQIFDTIKQAKDKLQPARVGYGTGVSYINVQRDIIDKKTNKWWEGANYDGPSDKTVAVVKFESLQGEPLAVYFNYACHAVVTGNTDMVSGDWPGEAERYIEDSFDDKCVALFAVGAQGDQNPIFFQQTFDLRDIRVKDYASRGQDISNAMPSGGAGLNKQDPTVKRLLDQQKMMIKSMGQFMGEEVKRVMREMDTDRLAAGGRIYAGQKMVSFPGRDRIGQGRAAVEAQYRDGADVRLRLSLLMIDDIAIAGSHGEIYSMIATRFKRESPIGRSIFVSMANGSGNSGYIPDDTAFGHQTFEVLSSRCKPGYAESAIVNGLLDLIADAKQAK